MILITILKRYGKVLLIDYYLDYWKAFIRLCWLRIRYGVSVAISKRPNAKSNVALDIVIPVIDKDSDTLPFVIDSAREYIRHPITNIYLVCPKSSERIKSIAANKKCVTVDETEILEIGKKDINYQIDGVDRSGWLYQQFLKWCGEKFTTEDHYLILDSDTVLIAPHVFIDNGKQVFDYCDSIHVPYFKTYERLTNHFPHLPVSFTSHHSLIDKKVMVELKANLAARHGMIWYRAIMAAVDPLEMSSQSDYDTYGHFFYDKMKQDMQIRYWFNKSLSRKSINDLAEYKTKYQGKYRTLSFHEYRKD